MAEIDEESLSLSISGNGHIGLHMYWRNYLG